MRKIMICLSLLCAVCGFAQRQMENLGRGLVAQKVSNGIYVNWRITGQEWYGTAYNLYRDGVKLNGTPITGASNYLDQGGSTASVYTVTSVKNGAESTPSKPAIMVPGRYLNIQLRDMPGGYHPNDATVADLDGDGEMEILVKRVYSDWSVNAPHYSFFEAYKLDGTFLWAINVGPNIMDDVETDIAAFDFDGDGKAEVFMRTSEGTTFGDGATIGDTNGDGKTNYRSGWSQYLFEGPEFLSLIDGETGKELDRIDYIPRTFDGRTYEDIWGSADGGHRCSKYFFGAPYLDGKKPSLFISRGIYTRIVMRTYDVVNKKLVFKWEFNSDSNPGYAHQGYHNYTIADVDGDGCDEIVYGSMAVNNDGKGLYTTGLGHGDALHVGDLDPYRKGLEVWACHENPPYGTSLRDAATGKILLRRTSNRDTGRCMAANVSDDSPGTELWGAGATFSATTLQESEGGGTYNFNIFWDGDLLQETFDYASYDASTYIGYEGRIFKFKNGAVSPIFTTSGTLTNNASKGTPCIQADILGDWREEFIMRSADNKNLRIYMTTDPTEYRIYTLLHDMQYRQAICWQMGGYNQPPHTSFFLGESEGITLPPPPVLNNDKLVYSGSGAWNGDNWTRNGTAVSYTDGASLLFDADSGGTVTVASGAAPELLTVNSKGNQTLQGGSLTGAMQLNKQGAGTLTLNSDLLYTGPTQLWNGVTVVTSDIQKSPVWMNRFAELNLKANAKKGIIQEYGSVLRVGNNHEKAIATVSDSLWMKKGAQFEIDIYDADFTADLLKVNGNLILGEEIVLTVIPHASGEKIKPGEYLFAEVNGGGIKGTVDFDVRGLEGIPCQFEVRDHKIYLIVIETRAAASVVWDGAYKDGEWDLASTKNVLHNGVEDWFVTGDHVTMNDNASSKTVHITADVSPASLTIDADADYSIAGKKAILGELPFIKKGSGTVTISNAHMFTGKIEILEGTVAVSSLANSITAEGALGGVRPKASDFVIDGGILKANGMPVISSSPLTIGAKGATLDTGNGEITLEGVLSGTGVLTKTGSDVLSLAARNSHASTVLNSGTLYLSTEEALAYGPGSKVVLNGGTVDCISGNSYSNAYWNLEVPAGKTGRLNLDMRCDYYTNVTGSGTLNLYTPYIRSMLFGNWNTFEGTLNVTADSDGGDVYLNNGYGGFSNANVNLASNVVVYNSNRTSVGFGSLTGTGVLGGNDASREPCIHEWVFGDKKSAYKFDGIIYWGNVTKIGNSTLTLSGSKNTYANGTNVKGGTLILTNTTGSAVGTGKVTVQEGATLSLSTMTATSMGEIQILKGGSLLVNRSVTNGKVTLENGSTLQIGTAALPYSSFTARSVTAKSGSEITFDIRSRSSYDKLQLSETLSCEAGTVIRINAYEGYVPAVTDTFQIVSTRISGTEPAYELGALPTGYNWDTSRLGTEGKLAVKTWTDGITTPEWSHAVRLYPSPATEDIEVLLPKTFRKISTTINTMQGATLLTGEFKEAAGLTIPVRSLSSGIYLLVLETEEGKSVHRFIKK